MFLIGIRIVVDTVSDWFVKAVLGEESIVEAREIVMESVFNSKSEWMREPGAGSFFGRVFGKGREAGGPEGGFAPLPSMGYGSAFLERRRHERKRMQRQKE